jgi:hypothetical protein
MKIYHLATLALNIQEPVETSPSKNHGKCIYVESQLNEVEKDYVHKFFILVHVCTLLTLFLSNL